MNQDVRRKHLFFSFIQDGTPDEPHVCVLCLYLNFVFVFLFLFFCFYFTLLLSSFWTSRGSRCRAFSSMVGAFNYIAHRVQHCSSAFAECCYLTLSRFPQVNLCTTSKSSHEFLRVCTRRDSNTRNCPIPGSSIPSYITGATM